MRRTDDFLAELGHRGIRITIDGSNLRAAPREALTAADLDELRARKPEILALLRHSAAPATAAIPRAPRTGPLPLSHAQERLWFLSQLEGQSTAYSMPMTTRLVGRLHEHALARSLRELVCRHEILRTRFVAIDGEPRQLIDPPGPSVFTLGRTDLVPLPAGERDETARRLLAEQTARPFRLDSEPPLRASLLRLGDTEHLLHVNLHHIAADGLSLGLLFGELAALYTAFCAGRPSPLPELPIQYADYAVWHRAHLESPALADKLAHWKRTLAGAPPLLTLPQDAPRPARSTLHGGSVGTNLDSALTARLRRLGQQNDTTLFVTLLAAFGLLLSRLSGELDLVIGTPVAGRSHVELEGLVGLFLNALPLRADLSGNPPFTELLARTRRVTLDAFAHQDIPFEKLVAELAPARQLNHAPIFQVAFNMVPPQTAPLALPGLAVSDEAGRSTAEAKLDLTLYAVDLGDRIELRAVYDQTLFLAPRMQHFIEQYEHLVQQLAADPGRCIDDYNLVTPHARTLLPDPAAALPEPAFPTVPVLVAEWAARTPEATALVRGTDVWTYRELAQQAARIAGALRDLGVQDGDLVAIWGSKSLGLIASMLGILDAGGAFLLLDPRLPRPRLGVMLEESGARHVVSLTRDDRESAWLTTRGLRELSVHPRLGLSIPETPLPLAARPAAPDAPAYVFFTSGTSGTPKGVLGVHKGLSHFLDWERRQLDVTPADRVAQLIALSFDAILRDVFLPLTSGASLALPDDDDMVDGRRLADWIERDRITFLHTVPSVFETWLADIPAGRTVLGLRCAVIAGEPLRDSLIRRVRERFPATRLVNFYGTTETTMSKFFFVVPDPPVPGVQPIGHSLPQTQGLILTPDRRRLCGIGEPGEIAIRTPFRTRGYLRPSEADASRFTPNPFTGDPGDLIYLTGDVGRYRPDGTLAIFGRRDEQVKIRGIRVELRGIEAVLAQHPDLDRVAVTTFGEGVHRQIVAYVVSRRASAGAVATTPSSAALRHFMQGKVPDYMIPATFVALDSLPLNTSGKVDRRALPRPDEKNVPRRIHVPPRSIDEQRLLAVWESVLAVAPLSVRDNFFELGGHSLLAVRLMARIEETFGQHLPLSVVFQHSTVEEMTQLLRDPNARDLWAPLVPIQRRGSRPPLFCVPGLGGNVVGFHDLAQHLGPEQPVYGLQTVGLDGTTPPYATIEEVVQRYLAEIRSVAPHGPYRICGHSWGGRVAFAMTQELARAGEAVSLWIFDSSSPDMAKDPVQKAYEEPQVIADLVYGLAVTFDQDFSRVTAESLVSLSSDERLMVLRGCLEKAGVLAPGTSRSQVRGILNVFHVNRQMNYVPRDILPTPIVFFVAEDEGEALGQQKLAGWSAIVPVTTVRVSGAHVNLIEEPHVQTIARHMAAELDALAAREAGSAAN